MLYLCRYTSGRPTLAAQSRYTGCSLERELRNGCVMLNLFAISIEQSAYWHRYTIQRFECIRSSNPVTHKNVI